MKILIVDDREINRKLLRVTLQAEGFDTLEASDGLEALEVLRKTSPDVIISDVLMPNMDGYRLCKKVRETPKLNGIPFVVYTSTYVSSSDEDLALRCGADRFLRKPAPGSEILKTIQELTASGGDGESTRSFPPPPSEESVLKQYSELLVRKLEEINEELEGRVEARTSELKRVNQELEAFSYSVSHDLRAPLRSIDGFTRAILERHSQKLDDEGKADFERVCHAAQKMSGLIDAMLDLSGITSHEIKLEKIDISREAETILQELRKEDSGRVVQVVVEPGLIVSGDSQLLSSALVNLLGNAWKFTGKKKGARIEVGVVEKDGETAYFVKDNGAGFDMRFAEKLFGPFQRLHSQDEFSGTGVGLATVQRILHRHGGRIWAQSELGKGATFYFTLPKSGEV